MRFRVLPFLFVFILEQHLDVLRTYSWLYAHESLLEILRGQYGISGIIPGSFMCKAGALHTVALLWTTD